MCGVIVCFLRGKLTSRPRREEGETIRQLRKIKFFDYELTFHRVLICKTFLLRRWSCATVG
jgi:hypothetical protein